MQIYKSPTVVDPYAGVNTTVTGIGNSSYTVRWSDGRISNRVPDEYVNRDEMKDYVKSEIQKAIELYKEKMIENETERDFLEYVSKNYKVTG